MLGAMRALLLILGLSAVLLATPAPADEEPVSPAEFEDYAEGYTLYFEEEGEPFGSEVFEPDGETLWRYQDGSCMRGVWKAHDGQLCFYYGVGAEVICWEILRDEQGLFVRLLGESEDAGMELRITRRDKERPVCGDPGRGT